MVLQWQVNVLMPDPHNVRLYVLYTDNANGTVKTLMLEKLFRIYRVH